jgi:hypothetical protein
MRTFFFHYNKPASLKTGKQQITVHYKGCCHIVDNIECEVPTKGRLRKTQPRFVIAGKCSNFIIQNNIGIIT